MPGFKVHITASTALGVAYGTTAAVAYDVPLPACALAGGLCSVSGMLPDLDSGPGVPLRESLAFAAAVVPMLLIDRFQRLGLAPETIVLRAGSSIYQFVLAWGKYAAQMDRAPWHVPQHSDSGYRGRAGLLRLRHENPWMRAFNAGAVMLGFGSHLVLDEIWSIDFKHFQLKSSFGTAFKFWGDCWWSNLLTYANLIVLTLLILGDPTMRPPVNPGEPTAETIATQPGESNLH